MKLIGAKERALTGHELATKRVVAWVFYSPRQRMFCKITSPAAAQRILNQYKENGFTHAREVCDVNNRAVISC